MSLNPEIRICASMLLFCLLSTTTASGQLINLNNDADVKFGQKIEIIPGAVQLENGLILRGQCSSGSPLPQGTLRNSRLDLRKIDQGFRSYFVSTRLSGQIVPDNLAIPDRHFDLRQRSVSQKPMNYEIGLHSTTPFSPEGKGTVSLRFAGGESLDIDVGIVGIDYRFAKVRGLTHRWTYGVSLDTIPDTTLYAGPGLPSLLSQVADFNDGATRLNMVQMLMEAEKYQAAQQLLKDTLLEFPDLQPRGERLIEAWNDQVGDRLLVELNRLRDTGRHTMARRYARNWPDADLNTVIRIRARTLVEELDEEQRAVQTIRTSLDTVMAEIQDAAVRQQAMQICAALKKQITVNTLDRLAAYELLWQDSDTPPEARIALAASGWMLGADHAIDEFPEVFGLFQIRYRLIDYLLTREAESRQREQLISQMRTTEGFSVERLAQLIRQLPPVEPIRIERTNAFEPGRFKLDEGKDELPCIGSVPAEYDENRRYPLLIAFPRGGGNPTATLDLWAGRADRHGYIVVVPELFSTGTSGYGASARHHQMFNRLLQQLKARLAVDDQRVFLAGHGIGAEAAIDIATARPDVFAGLIPISPSTRKHFLWTIPNSDVLPWYVVTGTRQPSYGPDLLPMLSKLFTRLPDTSRLSYCNAMAAIYPERGFESYAEEMSQILDWMQLQKRPEQAPEHLNATILRSTDRDWGWLALSNIEDRYTEFDRVTQANERPGRTGQLDASIRETSNSIRLRTLPGSCEIHLGPAIPNLDLQKTIRIIRAGRTLRVDFEPSAQDLLEDFRQNRDRGRLCFMKVAVP